MLEREHVVDPITDHRHGMTALAQCLYNLRFLLRRDAPKYGVLLRSLCQLRSIHSDQRFPGYGSPTCIEARLSRQGSDGLRVIAGDHFDMDTRFDKSVQCLLHILSQLVSQADKAKRDQVMRQGRITLAVVQGNKGCICGIGGK